MGNLIDKSLSEGSLERLNRISITPDRLEIFMKIALWLISDIWEDIFKKNLGMSFQKPKFSFFEKNIYIDWKEFSWEIGYDEKNNKIFINSSSILQLVRNGIIKSDIWFTLTLWHEVWHSIQKQLWLKQSKVEREYHADFIAWYSLQKMKEMWLLDEGDLDESIAVFSNMWDVCESAEIYTLIQNMGDQMKKKWLLNKEIKNNINYILEADNLHILIQRMKEKWFLNNKNFKKNLLEFGKDRESTNVHWDSQIRKWNLLRWFYAKETDVIKSINNGLSVALGTYNGKLMKNI